MAWNAEVNKQIVPTLPAEKSDSLPPSALLINRFEGAPAEETWLLEGEEKTLQVDDKEYVIYFGKKVIDLPFAIELKEFFKIDYPGTATAKEFKSKVMVTGNFTPQEISMNEPLSQSGYTVYQASYEQMPDGNFASIFSINKDPGRLFKYLGGIILAIGIIIFSIQRSKRWQNLGIL